MIDYAKKFKIVFALLCLLVALGYPIVKDILLNSSSGNKNEFDDSDALNKANQSALDNDFAASQYSFETEIIKSWKEFIHLPKRNTKRNYRIAIGINTNVDLILSGVKLFQQMNVPNEGTRKNRDVIRNLVEFKECFMHFFKKGSAAERSISDLEVFNQVLKETESIENKQWFIGGNAALMAEGISNRFENTEIMLSGPVGPKLKELLNSRIEVSKESLIEKDEVHLILEYNRNDALDGITTKAANRFIVSHDIFNSRMKMMENFFDSIAKFKPELIVLSGLHLLESQSAEFRNERLLSLKSLMKEKINKEQAVHLELASIGDASLMESIIYLETLEQVNSLGLNEQELLFIAFSSKPEFNAPHRQYYQEINGQPDILKIIDLLEWLLKTHGRFDASSASKLTRIHFHSLTYHIIAIVEPSEWSNTESSLMSGSKIAAKQACGFDFNDKESADELSKLVEFRLTDRLVESNKMKFEIENGKFIHLNSSYPIANFERGNIKFYFTPVLVCKSPLKTVGLGDAISSNGLFYSLFNIEFDKINSDKP